jgi:beta-phosphoglucomutase-like phosphatase (HAD superfamily)
MATMSIREITEHHLDRVSLLKRFPVLVCGDDVKEGKPNPEIFLKAADLLHVLPENCVVLEDSISGIRAASNAGMVPIMVLDMMEPDDEIRKLTHKVVRDLFEAREVDENLMAEEVLN